MPEVKNVKYLGIEAKTDDTIDVECAMTVLK
jgi:hypothetical protein